MITKNYWGKEKREKRKVEDALASQKLKRDNPKGLWIELDKEQMKSNIFLDKTIKICSVLVIGKIFYYKRKGLFFLSQ